MHDILKINMIIFAVYMAISMCFGSLSNGYGFIPFVLCLAIIFQVGANVVIAIIFAISRKPGAGQCLLSALLVLLIGIPLCLMRIG